MKSTLFHFPVIFKTQINADLRLHLRKSASNIIVEITGFWNCAREIIKLLKADGWYLVATKGSHQQYKHQTKAGRVTIAGHPKRVK